MALLKHKSASQGALDEFSFNMEYAFKAFIEDFNKAINHNPTLSENAKDKVYGMQLKVNEVKADLSGYFDKIADKVSSKTTMQKVERLCAKTEEKIENLASNLARDVDKQARKRRINLKLVGKAFGNLLANVKEVFGKLMQRLQEHTSVMATEQVDKSTLKAKYSVEAKHHLRR